MAPSPLLLAPSLLTPLLLPPPWVPFSLHIPLLPPTASSPVLQATSRGYKVLGNLFRGSGYWSARATPMLHPRSDHGAVSYQGNIYVFGGCTCVFCVKGCHLGKG